MLEKVIFFSPSNSNIWDIILMRPSIFFAYLYNLQWFDTISWYSWNEYTFYKNDMHIVFWLLTKYLIWVLCYSKERQLCSNFTYMWKENVLNKSNDVTYCSTYFFLRFFIWKWIFNSVIFKFKLSLLGKFVHKFISSHFSIYIIYTLLVALFCY